MDIEFIVEFLFVVVTGLATGSFVTALIYRLPRGIPFSQGPDGRPVRSICPPCGRVLTMRELVPVFSWLFQKGCCSCGKNAIPILYPLMEGAVFLMTLILWTRHGMDLIDTPRYVLLPFVVAVAWLSLKGQGWPRLIDHGIIGGGALISFIDLFVEHAGITGVLPFFCAVPFWAHGVRLPFFVQERLFRFAAPALLLAVVLF